MSLENETQPESMHEQVAPTAITVAYYRTFTDIPYSQEMFELLGGDPKYAGPKEIAPMFEARYKLTDRLLKDADARNVLEIASGYSPRGMEFVRNPDVTYVETDMPDVLRGKRVIAQRLHATSENLFFEEANALDLDALSRAAEHFKSGPIAIVNEGLLRYLTMDEKANLARNVHALLERFGGVWITPDITIESEQPPQGTNEYMKNLTGKDIPRNGFTDVASAVAFFENLGFSVERHHYKEMLDSLVSLKKLALRVEDCEYGLDREAFVMREI